MTHQTSPLAGDRPNVETNAARAMLRAGRPERDDVLDAVAERVASVLARTPAPGAPQVVVRTGRVNVLA